MRVSLSDSNDIGQQGTEPLRVEEVEVTEEAVVIVKEDAIAVKETSCLVQFVIGDSYLSRLSHLTPRGGEGGERWGDSEE